MCVVCVCQCVCVLCVCCVCVVCVLCVCCVCVSVLRVCVYLHAFCIFDILCGVKNLSILTLRFKDFYYFYMQLSSFSPIKAQSIHPMVCTLNQVKTLCSNSFEPVVI